MHDLTARVLAAALAAAALAGCPSNHHRVSGTVSGAIQDGVLVRLAGAPGPAIATATTAGGGRYEFSGVGDGSYTVTPSLAGYAFAPGDAAVNVHGADVSGGDFVAVALPGTLDASFGDGGTVRTDFPDSADAYALAIQPDGRIVAAGDALSPSAFALARYAPDGALDAAFGTGGLVFSSLDLGGVTAHGLAVQPDGFIVAVGGDYDATNQGLGRFALARFAPDGALDPAFGAGGVVTTSFPRGYAAALGVALQPDGRIVAAGIGFGEIALARYAPDGALDPSFGAQGLVTTSFAPGTAGAFAVALQPDGKIVVAGGGSAADGSSPFVLARYTADGTLDAGFGEGGVVFTRFGDSDWAYALALQPDGKIVVAGYAARPGPGVTDYVLAFALARYLPDGTLDGAFGDGGKVETAVGGMQDEARAVAIQPDGKIVAAGFAFVDGHGDPFAAGNRLALARYRPDGTPDPTFGTGGTVTALVPPAPPLPGVLHSSTSCETFALAIQPDGKLVVAGSSDASFAVARFWP